MPTYQVEDARGRVLELDGDHEPSQEEAAQAFASAFPASEDMQRFRDAPDAAATETSPLSERGALIAPTNEQIAPLPTQVAPLTAGEIEGTLFEPPFQIPESAKEAAASSTLLSLAGGEKGNEIARGLQDPLTSAAETALSPGGLAIAGAQFVPGLNTVVDTALVGGMVKSGAEKLGEASVTKDLRTAAQGASELLLAAAGTKSGIGKSLAERQISLANKAAPPVIRDTATTAKALEESGATLTEATKKGSDTAAQSESGVAVLPGGDAETSGIVPSPLVALPTFSDLHNFVAGVSSDAKAFLKGAAGEALPRMVAANTEAGEAGVSFASARIAAPLKAQLFVQEALKNTGVDPIELGAALTEDNLRAVNDQRIAAGENPADVNVNTVIGKRGSPFATEADYQSFLADPATQAAITQYKAVWDAVKDPQYRLAASIDPATPLASRGRQTDARINLYGVRAGEPLPTGTQIAGGGGGGNLLATLRRKSPFARKATGESDSYVIDLRDIMAHSMEQEYAIAQKNRMDNALVEGGDAAVVREGQDAPILKGEATVRFPYRRLTIVKEGEPPVPLNANLYVRKSLAPEYRALHGTDAPLTIPGLTKVGERLTRASLVGLSEGTIHASNLLTAVITRPGPTSSLLANTALKTFGRADFPVTLALIVKNALTASTKQLSELAEIGALKEGYSGTMLAPILNRLDKGVRVTLDNVYQGMVDKGVLQDTVANRREFVSQVGQYNKRLQGPLIRALRESQIGPFATAGRNFNVLGVRTAFLSPGAKASSAAHAAALRAEALAGVVGVAALAAAWNFARTGQVAPPGVHLGDLYLSQDESGRQKVLPLADLMGYGRAMRVTGIRGVVEAKRAGLPTAYAIDQGLRDVASAAISPALGPSVRFGVMAASGKRADLLLDPNAATEAPRVAPGSPIPQRVANTVYAATQANPVVGSISDIYQGKTASEIASRQFTRFAPKSAPAPDLVEKLPRIVERKQMEDYIDDVGRRVRKLSPEAAGALFDSVREAIANLESATGREKAELRSRLKMKEKYQ